METSALSLLEAGAALYRRTFRRELWRYYAASAPFAVLLLWCWQRAANVALAHTWLPALALTMAYALRVQGTGAYSRRLLSEQAGGATIPSATRPNSLWTHGALVFLWVIGLPFVLGTGVFYAAAQYAPFEGARGLRSALRLAMQGWRQQWGILALAILFGAILLANLGLVLLLAPPLLHSLLGIGGVLGFAGTSQFLLQSSTFWVGLLLAVYLALDPLMKCALTVSYYHLKAARSGTDLTTEITRLSRRTAAAVGAALCLLIAAPPPAFSDHGPQTTNHLLPATDHVLRQAIQVELRQPAYAWHGDQPAPTAGLDRFLSRLLAPFGRATSWLGSALQRAWHSLERWLVGTPLPSNSGSPGRGWEHGEWILAGLCLLLIGLLLVKRSRRPPPAPVELTPLRPLPVDVATASAADQAEEQWFALARSLQTSGELRLAFRAAFLGGLSGLARRRWITIRRDRTNQEYDEEFSRRAPLLHASTQRLAAFRSGIRAFDEVWYGGRAVDAQRLDEFVAAQQELLADG